MPDDKTRLAQEGYQSKLARDAPVSPDTSEYYKMGEKIGDRYEVSAIHHGAMGVVYGCFDHQSKLPRALKTIRGRYALDKQAIALFESEAATWISLEAHPSIVRAYLVERFRGLPYVIADYVRGPEGMEGDLRGWLGHPSLTLPIAVGMALQIAQGMQYAMRKVPSLVHRDLKPANILVSWDRKAMVTDFGLVQSEHTDAGTPAYMSPEQWRASQLDLRSDIYSYGCILFEMFTAHRLFPALSEQEWKSAHLASSPVSLTGLAPEIPDEIDRFVRSCLEKGASNRPRNWDDVVGFFATWYHNLTGKAVVLDFSSLALDCSELLSAAYSLSNLKRYAEAANVYDRAIAIEPNSINAWIAKGQALGLANRYDESFQALDHALTIDPTCVEAMCRKGHVLSEMGRGEEAIQIHDRALAIDPGYANASLWKGLVYQGLKRYPEALLAYDDALRIDPTFDLAYLTLYMKGSVLRELGRPQDAMASFDQALSLNPIFGPLLGTKGVMLNEGKRYAESLVLLDQLLSIDPYNPDAWNTMGVSLAHLGRSEEAIHAYDHALEIDSDNFGPWINKGQLLYKMQRYEEALIAARRAVEIRPHDSSAWMTVANILRNLKRPEDAIEHYDRAIEINSRDIGALFNKANLLRDLKRFEQANSAYDKLLAVESNYSGVWTKKGNVLTQIERYAEAIVAYDKALAIDKNHLEAINSREHAARQLRHSVEGNTGGASRISAAKDYLTESEKGNSDCPSGKTKPRRTAWACLLRYLGR